MVVKLYANGLSLQFGEYDRETKQLKIFDGFHPRRGNMEMRQDGLCWLTLTLGSATNATDLLELEEQIRVAQASDGQWLVTEYPTMLTTVKAKRYPWLFWNI